MKNLFLLLTLILPLVLKAQFPPDTAYFRCSPSDLTLPELGGSVLDSFCGIKLTRITDYNEQWDWYPVHDYAKIQPWNADETMYKFYSVAVFDAKTYQIVRLLPDIYYSLWSNINPDLIYGFRQDGAILKYSVKNDDTDTLLVIDGFEKIMLGPGEGNIDNNDKYVALIGKNGEDMTIITVDLQEGDTIATRTFPRAWGDSERPDYIDWVSVSQSGQYTVIMWNTNLTSEDDPFDGHYGVEVYSTTNLQFLRRLINYGNHGDFGFTPDGDEVFVQFYGQGGTIHSYRLSDGLHTVLHTNEDFGFGDAHLSCRNIKRPGWAYLSTDPEKGGMILAIKLDGSQTVEIWGHHYSSSINYAKCPMPVPSPSGKQVMFRSDFGFTANPDEVYEFIANYVGDVTHFSCLQDIKIWPNPTEGKIQFNIKGIEQIEIFNFNGQSVLKIETPRQGTIDLSTFSRGVYIVRVRKSGYIKVFSLIKL